MPTETKSRDQEAHERKMAKINNSVVTLENIDNEDFQHSYAGIPYTIRAGERLPFPYAVGRVMAKHLAMRILRKEAEKQGKLKGENNRAVNLFTNAKLEDTMQKIIVSKVDQPLAPVKTEAELMKERADEMQQAARENAENNQIEEPESPQVTKADIVKELRARKVPFNPRANKSELLDLLMKHEASGGVDQ